MGKIAGAPGKFVATMDHLHPGPQLGPIEIVVRADRIVLSDAGEPRTRPTFLRMSCLRPTVYGVNTGFGQLANVRVGDDAQHQCRTTSCAMPLDWGTASTGS